MKTALTDRLQIEHPIMQAPVGTCAGPELAAAVSNAGALGSMAVWPVSAQAAARLVEDARKLTDKPFSVNLRADLNQVDHLHAILDAGARVLHSFWGDPKTYAPAVHDAQGVLICTVASEDEAKRALDVGADVLVAQGWEAGGHVRGSTSVFALVPVIVDLAGVVPVVAAGAVVDGRGLAAALVLGASGVLMGTRFVASDESRAHPEYKRALTSANQGDTVLATHLFDIGWENAPHRVLRNSTAKLWEAAGSPQRGQRPGEGETIASRSDGSAVPRYAVAPPLVGMTGQLEAMALYAGQGVQGIAEVLPAATIVKRTMEQATAALSRHEA